MFPISVRSIPARTFSPLLAVQNHSLSVRNRVHEDGHLALHIDIPGVPPEKLSIEAEEGNLVLNLNLDEGDRFKKGRYVIPLSKNWDLDKAAARLEYGVLTLDIPAYEPVRRSIPIMG